MEHDMRKIDALLDDLFVDYKNLGGTTYTGKINQKTLGINVLS